MSQNQEDIRTPLLPGDIVVMDANTQYVIDHHLSSGGFSLTYLAHKQNASQFIVLKELFPCNADYMIAKRDFDGKIKLFDPMNGSLGSDSKVWDAYQKSFEKEAELTKKVGILYDASGSKALQNNPDVLGVDGPFRDTKGNTYLAINTLQGESFERMIEEGFVKTNDQGIMKNKYLSSIVDVLAKVSLHLSHLHDNCHLLHLDISPNNILVSYSDGQTTLRPYIIDYGSALELEAKDTDSIQYTANPYAAPELSTLAVIGDAESGYSVDASTDTYAVGSILFWAVTGWRFESEMMIFTDDWESKIQAAYPKELHGALAEKLITVLLKALSSDQRERYVTANELYLDLVALQEIIRAKERILQLVEPDELISYAIMDQHPLYEYSAADGNNHVLCLGCGIFVKRMILSLLSTGQMIGKRLYIHIVSHDPEQTLTDYLLQTAPELEKYSNLGSSSETLQEYVVFTYQKVSDLFDAAVIDSIAEEYKHVRYHIISLGSNEKNANMANLFGKAYSKQCEEQSVSAIIHYYCSEEVVANTGRYITPFTPPDWLQIKAFGSDLPSYYSTIDSLGHLALKVAYLYDKLYQPRISIAKSAEGFAKNVYNQRSSCASALHLKYKLASLGIAPNADPKEIIAAYLTAHESRNGELLELEHRRWMMYMIADQYRAPTVSELKKYGYEMLDNGSFNGTWKCIAKHLHHCLVPCSTAGIILKNMPYPEWDAFETIQEIDDTNFDDLDKMSLKVHLLGRQRVTDYLTSSRISNLFDQIKYKLSKAGCTDANALSKAISLSEQLYDRIMRQTEGMPYADHGEVDALEVQFDYLHVNMTAYMKQIKEFLSLLTEVCGYIDYKSPDCTIIDNLLWVLYSDNNFVLIKPYSKSISDNIVSTLLLEPKCFKGVGFDALETGRYTAFFREHGLMTETSYDNSSVHDYKSAYVVLDKVVRNCISGRNVLIDIRGADEFMVLAAAVITHEQAVSLIYGCSSNQAGMIQNIFGFPTASAYTLQPVISAEAIFSLYGAHRLDKDSNYKVQLRPYFQTLWDFYHKYQEKWNKVIAFFANRGNRTSVFLLKNVNPAKCGTKKYEYLLPKSVFDKLKFNTVMGKLVDSEFITGYALDSCSDEMYNLRFDSFNPPFVSKAFDEFFRKAKECDCPLYCSVEKDEEKGCYKRILIDAKVYCYYDDMVDIDFQDKVHNSCNGKKIKYREMIPILEDISKNGLITDLTYHFADPIKATDAEPQQPKFQFSFTYADPAIKKCLLKAGNILELFVYYQAIETGYFDDCKTNFEFSWTNEETVKNELDVILTKGLEMLAISCKSGKQSKEHLYEIRSLVNQFSLNSKPVIVYSSNLAVDESGRLTSDLAPIKARAHEMGVYLVYLDELENNHISLGEKLIRIADGTDQP